MAKGNARPKAQATKQDTGTNKMEAMRQAVSVHGVGAGRHRELRGGRPDKRIKQNGDGCKRLRRVD